MIIKTMIPSPILVLFRRLSVSLYFAKQSNFRPVKLMSQLLRWGWDAPLLSFWTVLRRTVENLSHCSAKLCWVGIPMPISGVPGQSVVSLSRMSRWRWLALDGWGFDGFCPVPRFHSRLLSDNVIYDMAKLRQVWLSDFRLEKSFYQQVRHLFTEGNCGSWKIGR